MRLLNATPPLSQLLNVLRIEGLTGGNHGHLSGAQRGQKILSRRCIDAIKAESRRRLGRDRILCCHRIPKSLQRPWLPRCPHLILPESANEHVPGCCACAARPRGCRAAERGQQLPSSDGDRHTPLPCEVRGGEDITP